MCCRPSLEERFWAKVNKQPGDGCWLWTAAKGPSGHGFIGVAAGRTDRAHRVSYRLNVGPIPPGLLVRHLCNNAPCVRPDHLALGTHKDNMRDLVESGYEWVSISGERNRAARLTANQVRDIRRRHADGGVTQADLAEEYGVAQTTVGRIIRRQKWKSVA